jgi:hypothetical protein
MTIGRAMGISQRDAKSLAPGGTAPCAPIVFLREHLCTARSHLGAPPARHAACTAHRTTIPIFTVRHLHASPPQAASLRTCPPIKSLIKGS